MSRHNRIEKIEQFLKENPNDPFLLYALAMEWRKLENYEKAISVLQTLLDRHPDYLGTYYQLGQLLEMVNRKPEARLIYDRGVAIAEAQNDQHTLQELKAAKLAMGSK